MHAITSEIIKVNSQNPSVQMMREAEKRARAQQANQHWPVGNHTESYSQEQNSIDA
jgi:hypothetical protein